MPVYLSEPDATEPDKTTQAGAGFASLPSADTSLSFFSQVLAHRRACACPASTKTLVVRVLLVLVHARAAISELQWRSRAGTPKQNFFGVAPHFYVNNHTF